MLLTRRPKPSHETSFLTPKLGNLLMLRLAAFLKDSDATLRDIDEEHAVFDVGGPSFAERVFGQKFVPPVRVELTFTSLTREEGRSWNEQVEVGVLVTAARRHSPQFAPMAAYVCRELRGYFAAV